MAQQESHVDRPQYQINRCLGKTGTFMEGDQPEGGYKRADEKYPRGEGQEIGQVRRRLSAYNKGQRPDATQHSWQGHICGLAKMVELPDAQDDSDGD